MKQRNFFLVLFVFLFVVIFPIRVNAENQQDKTVENDYKWKVSLFGGPQADQTLGDIFTFQASYSDGNYVVAGALAREIYRYKHYASLEVEGLVANHFGNQAYWEFVGDLLARWHVFPWNEHVRTTAAIAGGLSYYTEVSEVERTVDEDAQRLLIYMGLEVTLGLPEHPRWDLMFRIHHRSSAGEVLGTSGSNYVCAGLKFAF